MNWALKDEPLLTEEEIEYFYKIAVDMGVKNVRWSGLTKRKE